MSQQTLTAPTSGHWHVWRIALTGKAAFMSRPYLKRDAATQAARRWSTEVGWRWFRNASSASTAHASRNPSTFVDRLPASYTGPAKLTEIAVIQT